MAAIRCPILIVCVKLHANRGMIFPLAFIGLLVVILVPLADGRAGLPAGRQHHAVGDRDGDDDLRAKPAGIRGVSVAAAGDDAVPPGAERRHHAADSYRRRSIRRRAAMHGAGRSRRHLRQFVTGGSLAVGIIIFIIIFVIQFVVITKGATRISRSGGPLHLGRHARQADGDRRRPERRRHHRSRGRAAPRGNRAGGRLLRCHGRCHQVRPRRRHRRHHHHVRQHPRRACTSAWSSTAGT